MNEGSHRSDPRKALEALREGTMPVDALGTLAEQLELVRDTFGDVSLEEEAAAILPWLRHSDSTTREAAARALAETGSERPEVREELRSAARDSVEPVRVAVSRALTRLPPHGDDRAVLTELLDDPSPRVRWHAVHALARLGESPDRGWELLLASIPPTPEPEWIDAVVATGHRSESAQRAIADAWIGLEAEAEARARIERLDRAVAPVVVRVGARHSDRRHDALAELLRDRNPDTFHHGVVLLESLDDPEVVDALLGGTQLTRTLDGALHLDVGPRLNDRWDLVLWLLPHATVGTRRAFVDVTRHLVHPRARLSARVDLDALRRAFPKLDALRLEHTTQIVGTHAGVRLVELRYCRDVDLGGFPALERLVIEGASQRPELGAALGRVRVIELRSHFWDLRWLEGANALETLVVDVPRPREAPPLSTLPELPSLRRVELRGGARHIEVDLPSGIAVVR